MEMLICFDMDGVIFPCSNFWLELHKRFGTFEEGIQLTERYLHSDYPRLVKEVVGRLWKGKDAKPYYDLVRSLPYLEGVGKVFSYISMIKMESGIISASSIDVARRVQKDFGVDHIFANELVIRDGKVTGDFLWPVGAGQEHKALILTNLCKTINIPLSDTLYIGDSDLDIEAFKVCGVSIAFNSSSNKLRSLANHIVDGKDLSAILPIIRDLRNSRP